jgi:hypothetical protein
MDLSGVAFTEARSRLDRYPGIHRVRHAGRQAITITTVVRKQLGGSQSRLVRCNDGKLYVLKMNPTLKAQMCWPTRPSDRFLYAV